MIFHTLSLQHFLGFRHRQVVPIANRGLVWIRGANQVSASADQNGVGKTSLAHALAYVYFGQTLDGRKADDVACRFTELPCIVTVEGQEAQITRGRRPKVFEILPNHGNPIGQDDKERQAWIESQLGFGFRTFRNAVVFGQGSFERFAQAEQDDQLRMLDEIQGLDFREALKRAKAWRDRVDEAARTATLRVLDLQRLIGQGEAQEADLIQRRDAFDASRREQLKTAEARLKLNETGRDKQADAVTRMTILRKSLPKIQAYVTRLEEQAAHVLVARRMVETGEQALEQARASHASTLAKIDRLKKAGKCPTCRGETGDKIVGRFFDEVQDADQKIRDAHFSCEQHRELLRQDLATFQAIQAEGEKLGGYDRPKLLALEAEIGDEPYETAQRVLASYEDLVIQLRAEVSTLKTKTWAETDLLDATWNRLREDRLVLRTVTTEQAKAAIGLRAAEYWVEAFGDYGIRSLLFDSVSGFLMERVTYHLGILAAGEASVPISAQTKNKSGTLRERLSIAPTWTWGGSGSGTGSHGQDRRVDLALFAALQDLAESRSARPFSLKIFDEPGDALDMRGVELFVQWIQMQARERGMAWLITHNPAIADTINPDEVWTVVFDQEGSHVVME